MIFYTETIIYINSLINNKEQHYKKIFNNFIKRYLVTLINKFKKHKKNLINNNKHNKNLTKNLEKL